MAKKEKFSKILLVEGKNDQHVIWAFCKRQDLPINFSVEAAGNVEELIKKLPVYLKGSSDRYDTIGVVVDADQHLAGRWQSIQQAAKETFPNFPTALPQKGLIHTNEEEKKIGVWIMPNNELTGMLEDFLEMLVPEGDVLIDRVEEFLSSLEAEQLQKYKAIHRTKAKIHAWLSLQENPEITMGQSITAQYLNVDTAVAQAFEQWLRNLFG